ncbi:MAG: AAA family ATPase, partial [Chloroflexota bacterium]|nr:AAA family ATPase [Chloroflexota bacterium]
MKNATIYLPRDRRQALRTGRPLPTVDFGAVLFADISGFTPLTNRLVAEVGARRGADELTRQLNSVYTALIAEVDRFGGSVIGFSGDAITCWFSHEPTHQQHGHDAHSQVILRAVASALAMQAAMTTLHSLALDDGLAIDLAIKTAIAAGPVQRILVGDPTIQLIDVLAGSTLDRMAAAEGMAQKGEVLLDTSTLNAVQGWIKIAAWRTHAGSGERYASVTGLHHPVAPLPPDDEQQPLAAAHVKPWVLPAVYARLQSEQGRFLAELRPATALFLRFTGLEFDQDESAGAKLDAYIRWVQRTVVRYEGALIQLTTGDKGSYLYAAFGAPIAHDDDCLRAVAVALELRVPPPEFTFISTIQIGISQGLMRVGAYGSATRRTYGVLGEETNIAARLMSQAAPGQIVVSQVVADGVRESVQMLDLGLVKLKGKSEAQPVYAVLGARPPSDERLRRPYPTPLVGREAELGQMGQALTSVLGGQGHLLRIEGNAGVGKSHLTTKFIEGARVQGVEIAVAACQSTSQDIAYFAGRQIARALFGLTIGTGESETQQIAQLEAAIDSMNPQWRVRMPLLGELLNLPIADNPTTAAFDPKLRQQALISLAVEIAQTRARQQPLLLLFEDVHWIDEASQEMLLALAHVVANAPILLLLVHRPATPDNEPLLAELAALPQQTYFLLDELAEDGVAALVRNRLGGPVAPLALALIGAQAQGNPFFTEELVDALIDANRLLPISGIWTLAQALVRTLRDADCLYQTNGEWALKPDAALAALDLGIPNTIHGIVLARLDRLPEAAKLTLKVASVIGRIFAFDLLAQAHPLQHDVGLLPQSLETLLRRDFLRVEQPEPHLRYLFKHNITQEVVYQTLLEDQLYELHQAVGEALEGVQPQSVEDLAFHFYNADLQRRDVRYKALHFLEAAGNRAQHDYANQTALNYFNRALLLDQRWTWLRAKIEILHILGRRDEERATLEQLAGVTGAAEFEAALLWGEYYESISEYHQARQMIEWALGLAQSADDREGEARCYARLGMIAWRQGDYESAEKAYQQGLDVIQDEERFRDDEAEARYGLGLVYRQQGKYDEAEVQFERDLILNRQLV